MIHNKHNLRVGQKVLLDEKYHQSEVVIFAFTPNELFATVYSNNETGDMWQVMTNRLTPIPTVRPMEYWGHAGNFHEEKS